MYSLHLLNNTIFSRYDPIPMVRLKYFENGKTFRSTYTASGNQVFLDNYAVKQDIYKLSLSLSSAYHNLKSVNIVLASEKDIDYKLFKKAQKVEYQVRYLISSLSIFWKVEVIEYTIVDYEHGESWKKAYRNYLNGPQNKFRNKDGSFENEFGYRTRIDIEYAPLTHIKEYLSYYELLTNSNESSEESIYITEKMLCKFLYIEESKIVDKTKKQILDMFMNRLDEMLKKVLALDASIIEKDYNRLLLKLLNIIYM